MPVIDDKIQKFIEEELVRLDEERSAKHEPSGKLSASMLYQPVRFQVLKTIGVPRKKIEPYVLGKFKRGNDVENWYVQQLHKMGVLEDTQKEVEYKGAVGLVDAVVDSDKLLYKQGVMPHEVKSVTNAKLRRINGGGIDYHYKIQGCFYALAMGASHYAIDIVSAEDLRSMSYVFNTRDMAGEVEKAIMKYEKAMQNWLANKELPKFEPNENVKWTANIKYAMFDEFWVTAPDEKVIAKIESMGLLN